MSRRAGGLECQLEVFRDALYLSRRAGGLKYLMVWFFCVKAIRLLLTVKVVHSKHYPFATSPVFGASQTNRLIPTAQGRMSVHERKVGYVTFCSTLAVYSGHQGVNIRNRTSVNNAIKRKVTYDLFCIVSSS